MTATANQIKELVKKHGFTVLAPMSIFSDGRHWLICQGNEKGYKELKNEIQELKLKDLKMDLLMGVLFLAWTE
jgi:hypothetical protein